VHEVVAAVQVNPSGAETTEYPVIGAPPSADAVQETTADFFPGTAVTAVGASGTRIGVTADDVAAAESPRTFIATTAKVYEVPLRRPATVH
jgi:hypothetical protein